MQIEGYGEINEHMVALNLKEIVRRAIVEIRKRRFDFKTNQKIDNTSGRKSVVTTADTTAEHVILRSLKECYPRFEIISEEGGGAYIDEDLKDSDFYFTVDPMCGSRSFSIRASHGIATTIAMVMNEEIVSVYIGDVMTNEIFGYRPDPNLNYNRVYRISDYDENEIITPIIRSADEGRRLLLRGMFHKFSLGIRSQLESGIDFRSYTIDSGSIALSFTKLWVGEVDGILLEPKTETPWDLIPILGISKKLGFVFLNAENAGLGHNLLSLKEEYYLPMKIVKNSLKREDPVLIIHADHLK